MISVIPFEQSHLEAITLKNCHRGELGESGVGTEAISFMKDGSPIAIFGGKIVTRGVIQYWGLVSDRVRECPIAFHKSVRLFLDFHKDKYALRRMQMTVRGDYKEGFAWAESLGFSFEGMMRSYGPEGDDYAMFGRVTKCQA